MSPTLRPGRPPIHGERMVLMPVYVTAEQRDFLVTLSAARGCSVAVLVREAVDSFMSARLLPTSGQGTGQ